MDEEESSGEDDVIVVEEYLEKPNHSKIVRHPHLLHQTPLTGTRTRRKLLVLLPRTTSILRKFTPMMAVAVEADLVSVLKSPMSPDALSTQEPIELASRDPAQPQFAQNLLSPSQLRSVTATPGPRVPATTSAPVPLSQTSRMVAMMTTTTVPPQKPRADITKIKRHLVPTTAVKKATTPVNPPPAAAASAAIPIKTHLLLTPTTVKAKDISSPVTCQEITTTAPHPGSAAPPTPTRLH